MRFVSADELDELGLIYLHFYLCYLGGDVLAQDISFCLCSRFLALGLAFVVDFLGFGVGKFPTSQKICSWGVGWVILLIGWVEVHCGVLGLECSWVWTFWRFLPGLGALGGIGLGQTS